MLKVAIVGTLLPALLLATLAAARDLVWWQILGVLPVSWYLADLVVGLVHFTGDFLAWPQFIGHHDDPHFMTTKGYVHHTFRSYCLAFAACRLLPLDSCKETRCTSGCTCAKARSLHGLHSLNAGVL